MILSTAVRKKQPLIHCITNIVVANFKANGLLAMGASPIMADSPEEMRDIAAIASAITINIGTLNPNTVEAMRLAGKYANEFAVPIVLDPVGAGASQFRKDTTNTLLQEIQFDCIRCNAGELAAIADVAWEAKGVDAGSGNADIASMAKAVAEKYTTIVAVTGAFDIVTDGTEIIKIGGGDERITAITGSGCLLSAVVASFLAVERSLRAVTSALAFYKKVGEIAASSGNFGDIASNMLTALHDLSQEEIVL